jgi:hypothetical protein
LKIFHRDHHRDQKPDPDQSDLDIKFQIGYRFCMHRSIISCGIDETVLNNYQKSNFNQLMAAWFPEIRISTVPELRDVSLTQLYIRLPGENA